MTFVDRNVWSITTHETVSSHQDTSATHAYQIPQQSNVGSDSLFLSHASMGSMRRRPTKEQLWRTNHKSPSCPFYVSYLANLAAQQHNGNESLSLKRSERVGPRTGTHTLANDEEYLMQMDALEHRRRSSARVSVNEASMLRDLLHTSSFTQVHV